MIPGVLLARCRGTCTCIVGSCSISHSLAWSQHHNSDKHAEGSLPPLFMVQYRPQVSLPTPVGSLWGTRGYDITPAGYKLSIRVDYNAWGTTICRSIMFRRGVLVINFINTNEQHMAVESVHEIYRSLQSSLSNFIVEIAVRVCHSVHCEILSAKFNVEFVEVTIKMTFRQVCVEYTKGKIVRRGIFSAIATRWWWWRGSTAD